MSVMCNLLIAAGFSLNGVCAEPTETKIDLPEEDKSVWEYQAPVKPEPKPKPAPVMPPIVVEKTIVKEVPAPPPPAPKTKPRPAPKPDPYRVWLEAQRLQAVSFAQSTDWADIDISNATKGKTELAGLSAPSMSTLAPSDEKQPQYDYDRVTSSEPIRNDRVVTTDRYITGIMEGGINSQLASKEGGDFIIQVSRDVFGYGTRNKLIAKGGRLVCSFESPTSLNATRIAVKCSRILLAGDKKGRRVEIAQLEAPVGDAQGRGGITGQVNNHFVEQYGTALMLAGISAAVRGSSAFLSTGEDSENSTAEIADAASQELGTRFGEISASILEKTTSIVPTITAAQGKRVQIRPRKDWYLKEIKS